MAPASVRETPAGPENRPGPVMVRRMLLIVVTALIVARPFILGEDPTLDNVGDLDPSSMLFTILWLTAAVMWAVWRLWSRQGTWHGGLVEAALFGVVLLTIVGAALVAPYKHAAKLMAWEWMAMAAGFFLVRQLAVSQEEQHSFFAVLLAGMVVLSVYALFQRGVEIPRDQRKYAERLRLREDLEERFGHAIDDDTLEEQFQRVKKNWVFGPYANPNSFAGYLALLLPGVVGAALLCARHKQPRWQVMLASCFATLGVVALGFTISRGAWLATLLATLGVIAFVWRDWLGRNWYYAAGTLAVLALLAFGTSQTTLWTTALGKTEETALVRFKEYWPATWRMIADHHMWFGVGPGQFGRYYPRYMDETAGEVIKEPHNFILEIWATCGIFTALALLVVFALFYQRVGRALFGGSTLDGPGDVPPPETRPDEVAPPVRWEFYVGGMAGLLLAFVLRVSGLGQAAIVQETIHAIVGAVFWFGSFALFEQIRWSNRARLLALAAGVTATLLNLVVSGGINFPSVACPLWCAAALALNAADATPNTLGSRFKPLLYAPVPVFAAIAAFYLIDVFYPIANTLSVIRRTTAERENLNQQMTPVRKDLGVIYSSMISITQEKKFIAPLIDAFQKEDSGNAYLCCHISDLEALLWVKMRRGRDLEITDLGAKNQEDPGQTALDYARRAEALDPEGQEGCRREYGLLHGFAHFQELVALIKLPRSLPAACGLGVRRWQIADDPDSPSKKFQVEARHQHRLAAAVLSEKWLPKDPHSPRLHFQLAESLFGAGEPEEARKEAAEALRLHNQNKWPSRRLSDQQTEQVKRWLNKDGVN